MQERADWVTYWHVGLDRHDVLLADGLPAESYLDTGNRGSLANAGRVVARGSGFACGVWAAQGRAPLLTAGAALATVHDRLLRRRSAHRQMPDPALGVVLGVVPGVVPGVAATGMATGAAGLRWWGDRHV